MKILVTAGNTMTMIDQVRGITNVFKGRTGTNIAKHLIEDGHEVTLLTSNPEIFDATVDGFFNIVKYRTYDDLFEMMKELITTQKFQAIIHSAAVSDYAVEGAYIGEPLTKIDSLHKISSDHKEMFLKLVPTQKIIDLIREDWGFGGVLVKFKLQVGITDAELVAIAEKSRIHSKADMIVANTLEGSKEYAYIIGADPYPIRITRDKLPAALSERIKFEYNSRPS